VGAREVISDVREIAALPRVSILLSRGERHEDELFADFRRRHPRYRVIRRKTVGVALLDLSSIAGRDDYLAKHAQVRRMERKARQAGYDVRRFDPDAYRRDLHLVNTSAEVRQGRVMDDAYLSEQHAYQRTPGDAYLGVFNGDTLYGYIYLIMAGDVAIVSRHIAHADHLKHGVMYMLTAAAVDTAKATSPERRFLMHDTYFGAPPGLRFFKAKNGFLPHRVRWRRDTRP
jgi:hypothetical protein